MNSQLILGLENKWLLFAVKKMKSCDVKFGPTTNYSDIKTIDINKSYYLLLKR